jgi:hypothetical protein
MLSHYTSLSGLKGIAESGTLWATNFLMQNDMSEYFYAWRQLQEEAFNILKRKIPSNLLDKEIDPKTGAEECANEYKKIISCSNGYGHLYTISFAIPKYEEESRRGNLTLWDRYTRLEGYCLQYNEGDINFLISREAQSRHYSFSCTKKISYGVNKNSSEFNELANQISKQLLDGFVKQFGRDELRPDIDSIWPPSIFASRIATYCGSHKDPAFEDEREHRAILFPENSPGRQFFTGMTTEPDIFTGPSGKLHIAIGKNWSPHLSPRRVIIGPKADHAIEDIVRLFPVRPEIVVCDIPVK